MTVYSVQRCNTQDEQIILDVDHWLIRIYGRQTSLSAPLHHAELTHAEICDYEGGLLSISSGGCCTNVTLTLAEFIQVFHYFGLIKEFIVEQSA
ncbi:hypothetical protein [Pleionea litopenaei]|uniref:Uncharacterized protein n=1 Tax=Pleionea litopenaei TaxID=3070815 RepID=A0AA51RQD6_9GAMM|nr:hypothetical protein [Pleionea sp. HL-JVS1]WMS85610.1 hypothetical protein Q9312_10335 [Pleionea sp. HL-JVS1]